MRIQRTGPSQELAEIQEALKEQDLPNDMQRSKKPSRTRTDPTTCKEVVFGHIEWSSSVDSFPHQKKCLESSLGTSEWISTADFIYHQKKFLEPTPTFSNISATLWTSFPGHPKE